MAWFEDGNPCGYFGRSFAECFTAAGWLTANKPFAKGKIEPEVKAKLQEQAALGASPFIILFAYFGVHSCELCHNAASGDNFFIPDKSTNTIWAAPSLIVHYIDAHDYLPPDEFRAATLACPETGSKLYFEQFFSLCNESLGEEAKGDLGMQRSVQESLKRGPDVFQIKVACYKGERFPIKRLPREIQWVEFDRDGGSFGRAPDNKWVLPGEAHTLDEVQGEFYWKDKQFYLKDTSTKGIFVNGESRPVGNDNSYPIQHGDRLKFGDYELEVCGFGHNER